MSAFVISKIFPSMKIDASQRFIFGLEGSPEPLGSFKLDNTFVPTLGSPSLTNFEMRNQDLSGYRWIHETGSTETYGSFRLQKFLSASPTGIDLLTFNDDGTLVFPGLTLGPDVAVPFGQLNYNWNDTSGSDPFVFNHLLTNASPFIKQYTYRISSIKASGLGAGTRKWDLFYDLGDPTEPYALLQFEFAHPLSVPSSIIPFKIEMFGDSGWTSNIYLTGTTYLNGAEAATKNYVDASTISLTGSVTGSGNVNGSFATSFSNSQTVSGATQTFNFNNAAAALVLNNATVTPTATTEYRINRNGVAGLKIGIIGDSPVTNASYINSIGGAPLYFQSDGTTKIYMNSSGSLVLGSLNTPVSKLDVYGGVQNIGNEESAIRVISALNSVKIELQCTNASGKLYEIRSNNTGVLDIVNRTNALVCLALSSTGDVTIPATYHGRRVSALMGMTGNATATVVSANTWTKVAGTTVLSSGSNLFSQAANNRLTCTSTTALGAVGLMAFCTFSHNVFLGTTVNFAIYKNGVQISTGVASVQSGIGNINNASWVSYTPLSNGDYVEIFCRAGAAANITVSDMGIMPIAA